jgi:hypothetical protein
MNLLAKLNITNDPAIMRLAHPARFIAAQPGIVERVLQGLGAGTVDALAKAFADPQALTTVVADRVAKTPGHEHLQAYFDFMTWMPGGTELGNAVAFLMPLRQQLVPAPYFRLDDELARLLEMTDIAEDIPVNHLRPPYPRLYIEFGTARDLSLRLYNVASGSHILEGAYIEHGTHPHTGPVLHVVLTGSPLGKADALDDATHAMVLPLDDEQRPLVQALRKSCDQSAEFARSAGLHESPPELMDASFACVQYLAKALMYIGLAEARRTTCMQRTEFLQQHARLKSTAKRAKAQRRAQLLVDHILISAPAPAATGEESPRPTGRTMPAHWRRGHYRMQPFGAQRQQRRVVWIRPTLVHGELGAEVKTPTYLVR